MKNILERLNSRLNDTKEWISKLEDRVVEITAAEEKEGKRMKRNENSLRDFWVNIKQSNICIIGVPEGEERDKTPEKIFEDIIAENIPNLGQETVTEVQEVKRVPYRINPKKNTPRHIVNKMTKIR